MSALPRQVPRFSPLRREELECVSAIEGTLYEFPWTLGNFRDSMNAGYSCWACSVDRELAGYAVLMMAAGEAHLLNISVASPWQGRGLGRSFLRFLVELARERHCERMLLEVRHSNTHARRLYANNGFIPIGVRRAYYPARGGREDAIVFELQL